MSEGEFIPAESLKTAVLFLVFNRPKVTRQVFESIKKAQPPRLYVAADGPREGRVEELERVKEVREHILKNIDWECEVKTLFRDKNLGCKIAVSEAITWFFEHEQQGIILEDDCLPKLSFFWFCEDLLNKYKYDTRVGQITGFNCMGYMSELYYDIFFTKYPAIWGWATWADRWKGYDVTLKDFPGKHYADTLKTIFERKELISRVKTFLDVRDGFIDTWDYQWALHLYVNRWNVAVPKSNLVTNVGFGEDATHTKGNNPWERVCSREIRSWKKLPDYMVSLPEYENGFKSKGFIQRFYRRAKRQFFE